MSESNFSVQLIEREIEFENVDPLFAENAEKPVLGHIGNQGVDLVHRQVARLRDARDLEIGGGLGNGRNGKVDEIGHADLPVSILVGKFRAQLCAREGQDIKNLA